MIAEIIGSVFTGGATGLLGILIQRFFDYKKAQTDIEMRRAELANQLEVHRQQLASEERIAQLGVTKADREAQAQEYRAEMDAQAAIAQAEAAIRAASYANDESKYLKAASGHPWYVSLLMGLVDTLRGTFRPGVGWYLVILCSMLWWQLEKIAVEMKIVYTAAQVHELQLLLLQTLLFQMSAALTWYFGARPSQPKMGK